MTVAVFVFVSGCGDSGDREAPGGAKLELPKATGSLARNSLQVAGSLPRGWTSAERRGVLRMQSPDKTALVIVAAPGAPNTARSLIADSLRGLRRTYVAVKAGPVSNTKLAGLSARRVVASGRNQGGVPLNIVLISARGKRVGYLVELFLARAAPGQRLIDTQLILNSLRLRG